MQNLYDALKANGVSATVGASGLTALDELFVAHGFFGDVGAHRGFYDVGETVGTTGYLTYTVAATVVPSRSQRPSPPPVPDAYVRVNVVDEAQNPLAVTQFNVGPVSTHLSTCTTSISRRRPPLAGSFSCQPHALSRNAVDHGEG